MATIFDSARNTYSQYVPRFVGSNFEQASQVGQVLDERYRRNRELSDKIAIAAAQDQYLEGDKAIKENMVKSIYGTINKIASSDKDFENSSGVVSQLAKEFFTNQDRLTALENYKRVEEAKALRTKLGPNYLNFGDNPDNFTTIDPTTGKARMFNHAIEPRGDYSSRMQQLLGKVADDGYFVSPTGATMQFNATERHYIKTGQINRISRDKLNNLIEGLIPVYKSTGEGQQDVKRLTQLEGYNTEPITLHEGKVTRQTTPVDEDIRNRFRAIAYPQSFYKEFGRIEDFGNSTAKGYEASGFAPTLPGSPHTNTSLNPIPDASKAADPALTRETNGKFYQYIDKKTKQPVPLKTVHSNIIEVMTGQAAYATPESTKYDLVEIDPSAIEKEMVSQFSNLAQDFPAIKDYYGSYDNFKKSYSKAVENHAKVTPSGNIIQPEQADNYSKIINATAAVAPIYFKEGTPKSLGEFAKDLGTTPQNIKFEPISVFYDSPNKDIPGGYIEARVRTGIGEGKEVKNAPNTVFIPLSDQFTELARPIDTVMKNSFYAGRDTFTKDNPYVPGIVQRDQDGNPISSLAIYTETYPKKESEQQPGKPAFDTFVFEGDLVPNGSGGQTIYWHDTPIKISDWKQIMIKRTTPAFQSLLNSGQTANVQDYKQRGIDF